MLMTMARCGVSSGSWRSFDTGSAARSEREPRPTRGGRSGAAQGGVGLSRWPQVVRFDVCGIPGWGEAYTLTTLTTRTQRVARGRRDSIARSPRS
jgi:hypothetical protein